MLKEISQVGFGGKDVCSPRFLQLTGYAIGHPLDRDAPVAYR
jgi:hypothetical protein